jgi:hypothetical protein
MHVHLARAKSRSLKLTNLRCCVEKSLLSISRPLFYALDPHFSTALEKRNCCSLIDIDHSPDRQCLKHVIDEVGSERVDCAE